MAPDTPGPLLFVIECLPALSLGNRSNRWAVQINNFSSRSYSRRSGRDGSQFTVKLKFVLDDGMVASELLSVNAFTETV
jgi:hypothetical protein